MTDRQAKLITDEARQSWHQKASSTDKQRPAKPWLAPNSREQVRDETIRLGFIPNGAVVERLDLPTTSPLPKYALTKDFASLFSEELNESEFASAAEKWQSAHLSKAALARVTLLKKGIVKGAQNLVITDPSGHTRKLAPGPSSVLTKAVIEDFIPRFFKQGGVLWISESASKVREYDKSLVDSLSLQIDPSKDLPDLILVDLGHSGSEVLFAFIEIVATDGPINEQRKNDLLGISKSAGFDEANIAFISVFTDRGAAPFKKAIGDLALGSYAWFMAEPDVLLILRGGKPIPLTSLRPLA